MIGQYFLKHIGDIIFSNKSDNTYPLQLLMLLITILSVTLGEIYLSWSLYLYLIEEIGIKNYLVSLIIAAIFIVQLVIFRLVEKRLIKKKNKVSAIAEDYYNIRNAVDQFILGFQKK